MSAPRSRYPGYDVLAKRDGMSWDGITRAVVDQRLHQGDAAPRWLDATQWRVAQALCQCVVAQPADRAAVPVAAMLDERLAQGGEGGWRDARMPGLRDAWRIGLAALDAESRAAHGAGLEGIDAAQREALVRAMQQGQLGHAAWQGMPPGLFFSQRVLPDLYGAYYAHPAAWSDMGFGGPANPRGYVRLYTGRRDAWEAVEASPDASAAERERVARENRRVR